VSPQRLRIDLHLHSRHSPDCFTTLDRLATCAREVGLDRIALTDHNTAAGALELARREPELVIVGQETKTSEGEVIGLFLNASLPSGGRPEDVMDVIHAMGGLTYLAHPFDRRRASFAPERVLELADRIDIIEVYNAWCGADANRTAAELAFALGKVGATGSDAHSVHELGRSWMEIEPYDGPQDFLEKLGQARHVVTELSGTGRRASER
jgi:predicted metal-dependent phosphoesterase TrpH